jgi:hybrid cluster-associated redox disulfide protein
MAKKASKKAGAKQDFKVTKDTLIGDAARMCPEAPQIMFSFGLHCIGCGMTAFESIGQGCAGHGMSEEETDALVKELNEAIEKHK